MSAGLESLGPCPPLNYPLGGRNFVFVLCQLKRRRNPIKGGQQRFEFRFAAVQFLGNLKAGRDIVFGQGEGADGAGRLPFGQTMGQVRL